MKLKKVFKQLFAWINKIWDKMDDETKHLVPIAITLTNAVKQFVDSPFGEFSLEAIKALIKGPADDILIDKVHAYIDDKFPDAIIKLKLINSVAGIEDKNEKVTAILNFLKNTDISEKTGFWINLSAVILECLNDGKITIAEATLIIQTYYHDQIKEAA